MLGAFAYPASRWTPRRNERTATGIAAAGEEDVGQSRPILVTAVLGCFIAARTACADDGVPPNFSLDLKGYIEGRFAVTGDTRSWEDGGLGKTRYGAGAGGNSRVLPRAEGVLLIQPKFGFDLSGDIVLTANDQQKTAIDVSEAFLQYKPAPTGNFGVRGRVGAFFPPISLENTGLAWTSPYTLTSSAIDSWVGEELKTIGGETTVFYQTDDLELGLTGSLYFANDPAGTLLAWRGWSFNDREAGLFDQLMLAPIRITRPTGALFKQAPTDAPFDEIDNKIGYYVGGSARYADFGVLQALWYDNRADDHALKDGQWAWRTTFWSLGYRVELPAEIDFIAQVMSGDTTVITIPAPVGPIVYTKYWSAYALLSKDWGRNRVSFRLDRFGATDEDRFPDKNNEHGTGLTFSYIYRPVDNHRLTLEVLHVDSKRAERAFLGLPVRAKETIFQASYRIFFGYNLF